MEYQVYSVKDDEIGNYVAVINACDAYIFNQYVDSNAHDDYLRTVYGGAADLYDMDEAEEMNYYVECMMGVLFFKEEVDMYKWLYLNHPARPVVPVDELAVLGYGKLRV